MSLSKISFSFCTDFSGENGSTAAKEILWGWVLSKPFETFEG